LKQFGFCGIEVELGFLLGKSLPLRSKPYDRDDVLDAVQSVTTTLEIVDSRFHDYKKVDRLSHLADLQNNGALVYGVPIQSWQALDLSGLHARLEVNGVSRGESIGGNTAGDPVRLLVWLANHAAQRGMPLGENDLITSGALTGMTLIDHPAEINGILEGIGSVALTLSA
jgi:2-keto-4-pentenoate hydratase